MHNSRGVAQHLMEWQAYLMAIHQRSIVFLRLAGHLYAGKILLAGHFFMRSDFAPKLTSVWGKMRDISGIFQFPWAKSTCAQHLGDPTNSEEPFNTVKVVINKNELNCPFSVGRTSPSTETCNPKSCQARRKVVPYNHMTLLTANRNVGSISACQSGVKGL